MSGEISSSYKNTDLEKILSKEYSRYKVVKKLLRLERCPNYWIALERVLYKMASSRVENRKDPVFLEIDINHRYFEPFMNLIKNTDLSNKEIKKLIGKVKELVDDFLKKKSFKIPKKYGNNGNIYHCDKFHKIFNKKRIEFLRQNIDHQYKKDVDMLILILLIRYESLISRIQWSLPTYFYQYLYTNENLRVDLFSSPLKCPLVYFGKDVYYFSLFDDIDRYFGSLGQLTENRFTKLMDKYKGKTVGIVSTSWNSWKELKFSIKLPLVMSEKYDNTVFYIGLPKKDPSYEITKYYNKIRKSSNILFYRKLVKGQYYFENPVLTSEIIKFTWGDELNLYVVGDKKHKHNYYPIIKSLINKKSVDAKFEEYERILQYEYTRYKYVMKILSLSEGYEWKNIVERFLNTMANVKDIKRNDQVFIEVPTSHEVYHKMDGEIKEKRIEGKNIIPDTAKIINEFFQNRKDETIMKYGQVGNEFYCNDFKLKMDNVRQNKLIEKLDKKNLSKYWVVLIMIVIFRYESILAGSQNWNIPFNWYNFIYRKYNVKFEGFASPLNSQLILSGDDTYFCSLFIDTDGVFGSFGNLFDFDIKKYSDEHEGKISVALNPPYIESIMNKMVDLIDNWFKIVPKLRVFTGLPYWKDTPSMKRLENHKYVKLQRELKSEEYYYENSLHEIVPKIYMTSSYKIFVLANYEKDKNEPPYEKTLEVIKPPY